jgi:hypothetical protein
MIGQEEWLSAAASHADSETAEDEVWDECPDDDDVFESLVSTLPGI